MAFGGAQRGGRQINDDHDVDDTDQPTGGSAIVNGLDIVKESYRVRTQLGYVSQELAVDDNLTGYENMILQARFTHIPITD